MLGGNEGFMESDIHEKKMMAEPMSYGRLYKYVLVGGSNDNTAAVGACEEGRVRMDFDKVFELRRM